MADTYNVRERDCKKKSSLQKNFARRIEDELVLHFHSRDHHFTFNGFTGLLSKK